VEEEEAGGRRLGYLVASSGKSPPGVMPAEASCATRRGGAAPVPEELLEIAAQEEAASAAAAGRLGGRRSEHQYDTPQKPSLTRAGSWWGSAAKLPGRASPSPQGEESGGDESSEGSIVAFETEEERLMRRRVQQMSEAHDRVERSGNALERMLTGLGNHVAVPTREPDR
jgi:hypothetical protein